MSEREKVLAPPPPNDGDGWDPVRPTDVPMTPTRCGVNVRSDLPLVLTSRPASWGTGLDPPSRWCVHVTFTWRKQEDETGSVTSMTSVF